MKLTGLLPVAALASAALNWDIYRVGTVPDFPWRDQLPADGGTLNGYTSCQSSSHFNAAQYKLSDLREEPPAGLAPWADAVEALFTSRFYPGSWQGVNDKGDDRDVVVMGWLNVPVTARSWIEEQLADEKMRLKRFMTVVTKSGAGAGVDETPVNERLLIVAPGELYNFLPLWVSEKSQCEGESAALTIILFLPVPTRAQIGTQAKPLTDKLKDLSRYTHNLQDDAVIAWAKPLSLPDRAIRGRHVSFSVDARHVRETDEGRAARVFWERAHAMGSRHHRKQVREERMGKRALTQAQRADKDEL